MKLITLLTDFGLKDGNVGVMKGVIWGIAPQAQIADISHNISPQNTAEAALILWRSVDYFPAGTVHTVVVDPGVGTSRRPIAASLNGQFFVGPDNGVITLWMDSVLKMGKTVEIIHLDQPRYWLPQVSRVFHGRDIFAPTAAHLTAGVEFFKLGTLVDNPVLLDLPQPKITENGIHGEVIHVDHFGNISTNIRQDHLGSDKKLIINMLGETIHGLVQTFGDREPGELVALIGSTGNLIICEVNGNATKRLRASLGEQIYVTYAED